MTVRVAIAGASGSIGTQALDVIRAERDRYTVVGLGVSSSVSTLIDQALEFRPKVVAVAEPQARAEAAAALPFAEVVADLAELVTDADVVVNGVVGFAGLPVTLATLAAGPPAGAGQQGEPHRRRAGGAAATGHTGGRADPGRLRARRRAPVPSRRRGWDPPARPHRADRQRRTLPGEDGRGPRRGHGRGRALAHPTWSMGPKITVDSSTLMNKGLEVIEAHELFGVPYDRIEVIVHPQSIVHSMVEFSDGSTIAQLSLPDMRLPIGYALAYPARIGTPFGRIDWTELRRLDFEPPDLGTFRCLGLAYEAGRAGGTAPAWLNAANEVAVEAFLAGRIRWAAIPDVLEGALSRHDGAVPDSVDAVIDADGRGRAAAAAVIGAMGDTDR